MSTGNDERPSRLFTCLVIEDHQASFPEGLVFSAGDVLAVEDRKTVWEGWIWCVNPEGRGAWTPQVFIQRQGDSCIVLRDYDSVELTVARGDILQAHEEAGGWLWCTDSKGRKGWVPASCVEPHGAAF